MSAQYIIIIHSSISGFQILLSQVTVAACHIFQSADKRKEIFSVRHDEMLEQNPRQIVDVGRVTKLLRTASGIAPVHWWHARLEYSDSAPVCYE